MMGTTGSMGAWVAQMDQFKVFAVHARPGIKRKLGVFRVALSACENLFPPHQPLRV
jgi:hypothetical protein